MPFGLCNAPATFELMIDAILRGHKLETCLCYLDDSFSHRIFPTHLAHRHDVLTCLTSAGLQLNLKKCRFTARKLSLVMLS